LQARIEATERRIAEGVLTVAKFEAVVEHQNEQAPSALSVAQFCATLPSFWPGSPSASSVTSLVSRKWTKDTSAPWLPLSMEAVALLGGLSAAVNLS
jgi:hypothetical protein